jgi:hypothetical protein
MPVRVWDPSNHLWLAKCSPPMLGIDREGKPFVEHFAYVTSREEAYDFGSEKEARETLNGHYGTGSWWKHYEIYIEG